MSARSRHPALLVLIVPPVLMASTCSNKKTEERPTPEPTVYIQTAQGGEVRIQVEVARSPEERRLGLMHRQNMDKGTGMIFIFEEPDIQTFWMKNTYVSLDMIFIGPDLEVVGIVERTKPLSLAPCSVDAPSQYVLEVEAGFASRHGVETGSKVRFAGFDHPG